MNIPLSGGASNDAVAAAVCDELRAVAELEREIEEAVRTVSRQYPEVGQAVGANVQTIVLRTQREGRSRLDGLRDARTMVAACEADGGEKILAELRRHRAEQQLRELAMRAALDEQRVAAHVRAHPLGPTEVVKMVESRGAVLRLRDGMIEVAPSGMLDMMTKMYIKTATREVAQVLDARTRFEVIAKVSTDDAESD
jgi:hypothetical protein